MLKRANLQAKLFHNNTLLNITIDDEKEGNS
jgi:hypothetical protein